MSRMPTQQSEEVDEAAVASTAALDAELERERRGEMFLNGASGSLRQKEEHPLRTELELDAEEAPAPAPTFEEQAEQEREKRRERFLHGAAASVHRTQPAPRGRREIIEIDAALAPAPAPAREPAWPGAAEEEARRHKRRSLLGFQEPQAEVGEEEPTVPEVASLKRHAGELEPSRSRREYVPPTLDPDALERKRKAARVLGVALDEDVVACPPAPPPVGAAVPAIASLSRPSKAARRAAPPVHAPEPSTARTSASAAPPRCSSPIVIRSSSPAVSPSASPQARLSTAPVRRSSSPARKLRPHASLPDGKITEGLFSLHLRVYLSTHFSPPSSSPSRSPSSSGTFTSSALQRSRELRTLAERLVRVNLARARRPETSDVVREKMTRLFSWTLGLLCKEGVVERVSTRRERERGGVVDLTREEDEERDERGGKRKSAGEGGARKSPKLKEAEEMYRLKVGDT